MGRREVNRDKLFNKSKDVLDRFVSKAREKDKEFLLIKLTTIAGELNRCKTTLYHNSFYDYFKRRYESVEYIQFKGLKINCKKWVEERKEERKERHKEKEKRKNEK